MTWEPHIFQKVDYHSKTSKKMGAAEKYRPPSRISAHKQQNKKTPHFTKIVEKLLKNESPSGNNKVAPLPLSGLRT